MEISKKCSLVEHKEIGAILFCKDCNIYMCNKCEKLHSQLFKTHCQIKLDKDIKEIFTGFCSEKNHSTELKFFCKTHNKLCCAECITKIKTEDNGQHTDCDIYLIKDIENEKKNKLKENIKCLEEISINLEQSINNLKKISEKINENKEELKEKIQKLFTKLRNIINDREDELLLEVDKKFNEIYFNEDIIKQIEKLPNKIKYSLEKGKTINDEWINNKLNSSINDCLNIENNIKDINYLNESIKKCNSFNNDITFTPYEEEEKYNQLIEFLKKIGKISNKKIFNSEINFDEGLIKLWLNNKEFTAELLYRKTRDGSMPKDFHDKCDNKGITITIIETTKGNVFGGYTELEWDSNSYNKTDKSTFIFSFNNKEKYTAKNNNNSIFCGSCFGPYFGYTGNPEIYFYNDLNEGGACNTSNKYTFLPEGKTITNEEKTWNIKEIEVYKIIYI